MISPPQYRRKSDAESRIVFFHIAKSAGTSVISALRNAVVGPTWIQRYPEDFSYADGRFEDYVLISGHLPIRSHRHNFIDGWITSTMLRNPSAHLASMFQHVRVNGAGVLESHEEDVFRATLSQDMTSFLINYRTGHGLERFFDNPQTRAVLGYFDGLLTEAHLNEAKSLLASLDVLGVTENSNEYLRLMETKTGLTLPESLPILNTDPSRNFRLDTTSLETLMAIAERTPYDDKLYQFALAHSRAEGGEGLAVFSRGLSKVHLADVVRTGSRSERNLDWGTSMRVDGDTLILHPCDPIWGAASVSVQDVALSGQREFRVIVSVPDKRAPSIEVGFQVVAHGRVIADFDMVVDGGSAVTSRTAIIQHFGSATVRFSVRIASGSTSDYSTVRIICPVLQ